MIGWSPRDDAMLLLGAYLYGFGSWDMCALGPVPSTRRALAMQQRNNCRWMLHSSYGPRNALWQA